MSFEHLPAGIGALSLLATGRLAEGGYRGD